MTLADLPSLEVLRGKLLGLLNTPATQAGRVAQHARQRSWRACFKAKAEKG